MNRVIWDAVGRIGDDLIDGTDENAVRNHFGRRRRNLRIRCGSIAACLCLAICLSVPLIKNMQNTKNDATNMNTAIEITDPTSGEDVSSLPWLHVLTYNLRTEKSIYSSTEQPIIELGFGLTGDALGPGTLKIEIDTGDFESTAETDVTIENFTYPEYGGRNAGKLQIPLIPTRDGASGNVTISFRFYPECTEATEYDGALNVGTISLSYVVGENEIVLSQTHA